MSVCIICCDSADHFMQGNCCHPICLKCGLRIRFLGGSNECPICRQEMVTCTVVNEPGRVSDYSTFVSEPRFEARGIEFETPALLRLANDLLAYRCCLCAPNETDFFDFPSLRAHMQRKHELFYCEICVQNILRFPFEFVCYNRELLARHRRVGTADDKSQRGHPLCTFCDIRYLDNDQLYRHLRLDHFFCHLCEAVSVNKFFANRQHLVNHFRSQHHICEEGRCRDEPLGVAFSSEIDLQYHRAMEHSAGSDRSKVRLDQAMGLDSQYRRYGRQDDSWGYSFQSTEREPIMPHPVPSFTMETADFPTLDGREGRASSTSEGRLPSWSKRGPGHYSLDDFPALGDPQPGENAGPCGGVAQTRKSQPSKDQEQTAVHVAKVSLSKPALFPPNPKGKANPPMSKSSLANVDDFPELPRPASNGAGGAAGDPTPWRQAQNKKKAGAAVLPLGPSKAGEQAKTKLPNPQGSSINAAGSKATQKSLKSVPAKLTNGPLTFEEAFPSLSSSPIVTNRPVSSGRWINPLAIDKSVNKKGLSQQLVSKQTLSTSDDDYPVLGGVAATLSANSRGADPGVSFSDVLKTTKKYEEPKPPDSEQVKKLEPPPFLNEAQFPPLSSKVGKKSKNKATNQASSRTVEDRTRDPSPLVSSLIRDEAARPVIASLIGNTVENILCEGGMEASRHALNKPRNEAGAKKSKKPQAQNGQLDGQAKRKQEKSVDGNKVREKEKKKSGAAEAKTSKNLKSASKISNKNKSEAGQGKGKDAKNKVPSKASSKLSRIDASESDEETLRDGDSALEKAHDKEFMKKQLKANCFRFFMLLKYPDVFKVCDLKESKIETVSSYREPRYYYLRRFFFFLSLQAELPEGVLEQLCHFCVQFKENVLTAGDLFSELLYLLGEKAFLPIFKELLCLWNDIHQQRKLLKVYLEYCVTNVGLPDNVLGSVSDWVEGISLCSQCSQVVGDEDFDEHFNIHLRETS